MDVGAGLHLNLGLLESPLGSPSNSCEIRSLEQLCRQGWLLLKPIATGLSSNHPVSKFAPGTGTASIRLVRFAHRIAESWPGLLVHQILHRAWENFTTSMAQFVTVAFDETSTFKVFADNASRSFS